MEIRLKIYASILALVVLFNALGFFVFDVNGIINWRSLIHSGWVTFATLLLFLFAFTRSPRLGYTGAVLYGGIFLAALANQFFSFSDTLNYHCMLFNLVLFTVYYLAARTKRNNPGVGRLSEN